MSQIIPSANLQYNVTNNALKQKDLKQSLDKTRGTVGENTTVKSVGSMTDKKKLIPTLMITAPLVLGDKFIDKKIGIRNEEGLLDKIAQFGDKVSDLFKLEQKFAPKNKEKISNFIKNNRFTKYFTDDYKAIAKASMAKSYSVTMSDKYGEKVLSEVLKVVNDIPDGNRMLEILKNLPNKPQTSINLLDDVFNKGKVLTHDQLRSILTETLNCGANKNFVDGLLTNINLQPSRTLLKENGKKGVKLSSTQIADIAEDVLNNNISTKDLSHLTNKLKSANLSIGRTALGKSAAKGFVKFKDILTYDGGGLISMFMVAGAILSAAKEAKEAPKGEKLATFMHLMSNNYLGFVLMRPRTNLIYKVGGNKYRGMSINGKNALNNLVKNTNSKVADLGVAKIQTKLIQDGIDLDIVKELSGKSFAEAKARAKNLKNQSGALGIITNPIKNFVKYLTPTSIRNANLSQEAKQEIVNIANKAKLDTKTVNTATKIAKIQKKLLLKGVDEKEVAKLANKTLKEAKVSVQALKQQGAKIKFWEKPLKFLATILDTGLDTIKSPTKTGKATSKVKGFAGGFARFALVMFVLSPLLQKPCEKLCHKIFGEPKAYLKKEKEKSGKDKNDVKGTNPQTMTTNNLTPNKNINSTNLLDIFGADNNSLNANNNPVNQNSNIADNSANVVNPQTNTNVQNNSTINKVTTNANEEPRYIPSIVVNFTNQEEVEREAKAQMLEQSMDKFINKYKKEYKI